MKVAVTGSTGLIGHSLVESLRTAGHDALAVVRPSSADVTGATIRWDPAAGEMDSAALEGLDAVVHLAGAGIADKRWTEDRKRLVMESRTRSTTLLAESMATLERPPSVLLSGSAVGYYGDTGDHRTDESGPPGKDFPAEVCMAWEAATAPAEDAGVRVAHLRTGIVLSTEGGALAKQLTPFKLGLGGRAGSGAQYMSWIHIDDEVAAIIHLLTAEVTGAVNLTAPEPVTNAEFTKTLGETLHRPTTVLPMIGPRILYGRELADSLLLTSQRVVPTALEGSGFRFSHPKLRDALADLLG